MKKGFISLAIAATLLCGCVQEQFSYDHTLTSVTATVESSDTRAKLAQEDGDVFRMHWEEGDRISVISDNGNIPFTLTSGTGTGKATFYNESGVPAGECFAVYPYVETTSIKNRTVSVTYPDELVYDVDEGRVKGGEYMIAVSSDGNFQFKNIHSYLRMTFTSVKEDELSSIVVEARNGATVSGTAEILFSDGTPIVRMTGIGKTVTVAMNGAPIGPSKPLTVDVPLAPVFSNGIKVTLTGKSVGTRTFTSGATVSRNRIVEMDSAPFTNEPVAMVNSHEYTRIDEALTDGVSKYRNPVVTILRDTEYKGTITVSGNNPVTLDLAGHTLKVRSLISKAKTMTLTDSSIDGSGVLESTTDKTLEVFSGEFTIDAGTVRSADSICVYVQGDDSNAPHLIFNGGTITSTKAPSHIFVGNNGTADMHGGSIVAKGGYGIHARASESGLYAVANVDGGSITGSATHLFYVYTRGKITVTDGFFVTDNGRVCHNGTSNSEARFYLKGGYFSAKGYPEGRYFSGYNATSVKNLLVSAGYFNVDPVVESAKACTGQALVLSGRGEVERLSAPVIMNGVEFPYAITVDNSGIVVGYSQNGTSSVTREAFKKAFGDAGAAVDYFEEYTTTDEEAAEYVSRVDALVIPGSASSDASNRSSSDQRLIRAAISQGKPVLGVCYGHQRICLVKGGSVPSVASKYPNSTIIHKQTIDGVNSVRIKELHSITIDTTSTLFKLLKTNTIMVNSSHNYCCVIKNNKLKVVATAPDGVCEALESTTPGEYLLGVQFHPEYLYSSMDRQQFLAIFQYIVDKAREAKGNRK